MDLSIPVMIRQPTMDKGRTRTVITSPGLALLPGPHPGARQPGGRVFAHGTWPGSARNS
ncbi:hypothetical protein L3Q82_008773 [Scortum barcoo]|uniref:Uncharacterized protein n=1 Tax=Scortum barcoo TaxID=214431 RepID=A0ACB8XC33_9TELE|nr:hypothetical protein L3Q82_008773 [Scortum barcoo]